MSDENTEATPERQVRKWLHHPKKGPKLFDCLESELPDKKDGWVEHHYDLLKGNAFTGALEE